MKTRKNYLVTYLFASFGVLVNLPSFALVGRLNQKSIEELYSKGMIHLDVIGLGGYQEECVSFKLKNNTNDSIYGFVEPGRRLISDDPGEQDILIVREMEFALAPRESKTVNGYGFCCESSSSAPGKDSGFTLGKLADENWLTLAKLISQSNYPPDAIQHAIWVLSDGHDIRSIPALADANVQDLRQSVADILGIEVPWYSFLYEEDSTRLYTGVANRLFAEVGFAVPRRTMISGQIKDAKGKLVHNFPSYYVSAGKHKYKIDMPLDYLNNGQYTFSIIEDFGILNLSKPFELGEENIEEEYEYDVIDG